MPSREASTGPLSQHRHTPTTGLHKYSNHCFKQHLLGEKQLDCSVVFFRLAVVYICAAQKQKTNTHVRYTQVGIPKVRRAAQAHQHPLRQHTHSTLRGQAKEVGFKPNRTNNMHQSDQLQIQRWFVLVVIYSMLQELFQMGPLCLGGRPILRRWLAADWKKVKPQTNDGRTLKWKSPFWQQRQKHGSEWMETNSSTLLFFFPHRVFAHPLWTARQQPQFTAHRDKQGRQEEECAWIEQGCTKSSGDEHLHRPTTRDLPPRCHAKNKFTPSHTSRRPQLTRWRLREDCERLTSNWLHGERVLARGGHRLIFYPLNLSQLLVQGERHLGRTASSDYPLSLRSFIWVCTDTSSMRLFKRLSGNFHHSPLVFLDFLSLKIKITKLDFTDWQNNVVIIQNALVMMHNHCPLPVDTYQAPWLSMRTHTFPFFSYKVTMIFAGWFLPA